MFSSSSKYPPTEPNREKSIRSRDSCRRLVASTAPWVRSLCLSGFWPVIYRLTKHTVCRVEPCRSWSDDAEMGLFYYFPIWIIIEYQIPRKRDPANLPNTVVFVYFATSRHKYHHSRERTWHLEELLEDRYIIIV